MKEIKDMTLTECIESLRDQTKGDVWGMGHRDIIELTDRIDTLLFEQAQRHDAWVDALENRINSLEAKHRWIPVSERMPTEWDFGTNKRFRVWLGGIDSIAIFTEGRKLLVWDDEAFNSGWTEYDPTNSRVAFTHWQHITPPEEP